MSRSVALVLLAAALGSTAFGQAPSDPRAPMPERPTVATHAFTVARGVFELEAGFERDANPDHSRSWLTPVVLKIGLAPRAQLNLASAAIAPSGISAGLGDISVGVKYRLADHVPVVGAFAVLPSVKFATGDDNHGTKTTDGSVLLISSHQFGQAALDVNIGYTVRSGDGSRAPTRASVWTVSGGAPITGPLGMVLEAFGYPGTSGPAGAEATVAVLAGPTLAVGDHAVLDAGFIARLSGPQPKAFYAGFTWNLGKF